MARPWNEVGRYGGVGIDLVLSILLLGAAGHWLDQRYFPGHDTGMMVGGLLGFAVGMRNLVVAGRRMQRDIEKAEAKDPAGSRWTVDESWIHKPEDAPPPHEEPPHEPPR